MEEGKGQGDLASSRQYGNALLGVRHQEEEAEKWFPPLWAPKRFTSRHK